jgi:hypothetical protein
VSLVQLDLPASPYVEIVQVPVTSSTRKIVRDPNRLKSTIRSVAEVCQVC